MICYRDVMLQVVSTQDQSVRYGVHLLTNETGDSIKIVPNFTQQGVRRTLMLQMFNFPYCTSAQRLHINMFFFQDPEALRIHVSDFHGERGHVHTLYILVVSNGRVLESKIEEVGQMFPRSGHLVPNVNIPGSLAPFVDVIAFYFMKDNVTPVVDLVRVAIPLLCRPLVSCYLLCKFIHKRPKN